ncbi:uncharacterized protein BYT42DRAFT_580843 [Radiomyces spectabilis]|uniref:uncharacterized protein n=1 Tax=Radiomyces spectabilis TaxID=64574 RepID=UPI00221F5B2F|nr:uncharacterized protein BYT42DRAFT_580843 [Radiomyces spectabilis]KAI8371606.1 hypothetical protein BYT42DRAFT_580843 [Radiomyces spectabilis]
MTGSFVLVSNSGKKISLEHASHPCPKCKSEASVQLMRSEKQLILLNKRIANNMRVRYECNKCKWKNEELPYDDDSLSHIQRYLSDESDEAIDAFYFYAPSSTAPTKTDAAY